MFLSRLATIPTRTSLDLFSDEFLTNTRNFFSSSLDLLTPKVDIEQTWDEKSNEKTYKVSIDTYNSEPKNINVDIIPNKINPTYSTLHIEINEKSTQENKDENNYFLKEIRSKRISRDVALPENVDYDSISEMKTENGLTTFTFKLKEKVPIPERISLLHNNNTS